MSEVQGEGNLLFTSIYSEIVSDETSAQLADSTVGEIPA